MSGQPPQNSHTGIPPQPINPYELSRTGEATPEREASTSAADRHYDSRLDWHDRRALLRSIAPGRVAVIATGIVWLKVCYQYLAEWGSALVGDVPLFNDAIGLSNAFLALLWMMYGLLILYMCWLSWLYCDRLQESAGGRGPWRPWSQLHYRTAWLSAAGAVLAIVLEAGYWLLNRWELAEGLAQIGP